MPVSVNEKNIFFEVSQQAARDVVGILSRKKRVRLKDSSSCERAISPIEKSSLTSSAKCIIVLIHYATAPVTARRLADLSPDRQSGEVPRRRRSAGARRRIAADPHAGGAARYQSEYGC